jgi:hypothetical protein
MEHFETTAGPEPEGRSDVITRTDLSRSVSNERALAPPPLAGLGTSAVKLEFDEPKNVTLGSLAGSPSTPGVPKAFSTRTGDPRSRQIRCCLRTDDHRAPAA